MLLLHPSLLPRLGGEGLWGLGRHRLSLARLEPLGGSSPPAHATAAGGRLRLRPFSLPCPSNGTSP